MQSRRVPTFATVVAAGSRRVNEIALAAPAGSTLRCGAPDRTVTGKADFRETLVVGGCLCACSPSVVCRVYGALVTWEGTRLLAIRRAGSAQLRSGESLCRGAHRERGRQQEQSTAGIRPAETDQPSVDGSSRIDDDDRFARGRRRAAVRASGCSAQFARPVRQPRPVEQSHLPGHPLHVRRTRG
jgi:hypothetical protein